MGKPHEVPDKFDVFEQWLRDNGSKFPKLVLQDYGNEVRGCHASDPIMKNDVLVEIPLKCLITVEMGKETPLGKAILASNIDLDAPKHIFLMMFILTDRLKEDSFFKPYYDILPVTLNNMPIFWTEKQLALLKGSYMIEQIKERRETIEQDFHSICSIAPELTKVCDLDTFKWARMAVCSRNFGIVVNGVRTAALVPYADMLNHLRPRQSKWQFEDQMQSFTITSLSNLPVGVQVYDSYGQKCNHRFLLNYGFSVESNVESDGYCPNECPFLIKLNPDDELFEDKAAVLRRDGGSSAARRVRVAVGDVDTMKLLFAVLRLVTLGEDDFRSCIPGGLKTLREATVPFSVESEVAALTMLKNLCMDMLDKYPTSYDEDVARLEGKHPVLEKGEKVDPVGVLYTNERHAVIQVRGEKEVLGHFLVLSELALDLLTSGCLPEELEMIIKERLRGRVHENIYQYCRGPILRVTRAAQRKQMALEGDEGDEDEET